MLARLLCHREICDGQRKLVRLRKEAILFGTCNPVPQRDSVFALTREAEEVALEVDPMTAEAASHFIKMQLADRDRGPGF